MKNIAIALTILVMSIVLGTTIADLVALNNKKNLIKNKEFPNLPIVTDNRGCEYYLQENGNYLHIGLCKSPRHYFKDNNTYKYVITLPEEYPLISTSSIRPDSLMGYISRDTLYIEFLKHK